VLPDELPELLPDELPELLPDELPELEPLDEPLLPPELDPLVDPLAEPLDEPLDEPLLLPEPEPLVDPLVEPLDEPLMEPLIEPLLPELDPPAEPLLLLEPASCVAPLASAVLALSISWTARPRLLTALANSCCTDAPLPEELDPLVEPLAELDMGTPVSILKTWFSAVWIAFSALLMSVNAATRSCCNDKPLAEPLLDPEAGRLDSIVASRPWSVSSCWTAPPRSATTLASCPWKLVEPLAEPDPLASRANSVFSSVWTRCSTVLKSSNTVVSCCCTDGEALPEALPEVEPLVLPEALPELLPDVLPELEALDEPLLLPELEPLDEPLLLPELEPLDEPLLPELEPLDEPLALPDALGEPASCDSTAANSVFAVSVSVTALPS
jgi:hypothetical protein